MSNVAHVLDSYDLYFRLVFTVFELLELHVGCLQVFHYYTCVFVKA